MEARGRFLYQILDMQYPYAVAWQLEQRYSRTFFVILVHIFFVLRSLSRGSQYSWLGAGALIEAFLEEISLSCEDVAQ